MEITMRLWLGLIAVLVGCAEPDDGPPVATTALSGRVIDANSNPLANASIRTVPDTDVKTTGADGTFRLDSGVVPGVTYRVEATLAGYVDAQSEVVAVEGESTRVELVMVVTAPQLSLSRSSVDFGAVDTVETVQISNVGAAGTELRWQAVSAASWLTLQPSTGTLAAGSGETLSLTVDRTELGDTYGERSAIVTLTSDGGSAQAVATLDHLNPQDPRIRVTTPAGDDFGTLDSSLGLEISNAGTGVLTWTATTTAAWLTVAPQAGTVSRDSISALVVGGERLDLAAGDHTAEVVIASDDPTQSTTELTFTMSVPNQPILQLADPHLDFGVEHNSLTFTIRNGGPLAMEYAFASPAAAWVQISAFEGSLGPGASETFTVDIDRRAAAPGVHEATIAVQSSNGGGAATVRLQAQLEEWSSLVVEPPVIDAGAATSAMIALRNEGVGNLAWEVHEDVSWLDVEPTAGVLTTEFATGELVYAATEVLLSLDTSAAPPGAVSGVVTVTAGEQSFDVTVHAQAPEAQWHALSRSNRPLARSHVALATDAAGRTLVFGGADGGFDALGDVWALVSENWQAQSPTLVPPGRFDAAMGHEFGSGLMLLYGGEGSGGQLFGFNLEVGQWAPLPSNDVTSARSRAALICPTAGVCHLVGGVDGNGDGVSTWATLSTDGTSSGSVWAASPGRPALADAVGMLRDDATWLLAASPCDVGGCGPWEVFSEDAQTGFARLGPIAGDSDGFAGCVMNDTIFLFGGEDGAGLLDQVLAIDAGGAVRGITAAPGPSARRDAALICDPSTGSLYLFGGADLSSFQSRTVLSDLWKLTFKEAN